MSRRLVVLTAVSVAILVFALLYYIVMNREAGNRVENVNTGRSYAAIQEAIDANETLNGHTLLVYPGKYRENVNITKTLTIKGLNRSLTIIEQSTRGYSAVLVHARNSTLANLTIRNSAIGIQCFYTIGCKILDNKIINCTSGIEVDYSNNTLVRHNDVLNSTLRGINLYESLNTTISNNTVENAVGSEGTTCAIRAHNSSFSIIVNNQLVRSVCGVWLDVGAFNNTVYHNNFVNNTRNACINQSFNNTWDSGYPSGGNYWSGYHVTDTHSGPDQNLQGTDGIGDWWYIMDEENFDRYPLMSPSNVTKYRGGLS